LIGDDFNQGKRNRTKAGRMKINLQKFLISGNQFFHGDVIPDSCEHMK